MLASAHQLNACGDGNIEQKFENKRSGKGSIRKGVS